MLKPLQSGPKVDLKMWTTEQLKLDDLDLDEETQAKIRSRCGEIVDHNTAHAQESLAQLGGALGRAGVQKTGLFCANWYRKNWLICAGAEIPAPAVSARINSCLAVWWMRNTALLSELSGGLGLKKVLYRVLPGNRCINTSGVHTPWV